MDLEPSFYVVCADDEMISCMNRDRVQGLYCIVDGEMSMNVVALAVCVMSHSSLTFDTQLYVGYLDLQASNTQDDFMILLSL